MNIHFEVEKDNKSILLNNRWRMYPDGIIYDTKSATDIPLWIFEFRNFVLENYKKMKWQIK